MGFEAAVILAVLVEVVDAPFGVLVIELRAQEILSPCGANRRVGSSQHRPFRGGAG